MKLYLNGYNAQQSPMHVVHINPGLHLGGKEMPSEWVDGKNNPLDFRIEFVHGVADVPDHIHKYMIKEGLASKSRVVVPNPHPMT